MKSLTKFAIAGIGLAASYNAFAIPIVGNIDIDFRTDAWRIAIGSGNETATIGDVTLNANNDGRDAVLTWDGGEPAPNDGIDGVGVDTDSSDDANPDEIDPRGESLDVLFSSAMDLSGAWLTDFFDVGGPYGDSQESGFYRLDFGSGFGSRVDFLAMNPDPNGERFVDFGGTANGVVGIRFGVRNAAVNHDYSLAGIELASIPEPGTLALLSLGLLGFGVRAASRKA